MPTHIPSLVRYNLWANKRITDALLKMEAARLVLEQKSSFPTIRQTLLHTWGAEELWYKRLHGESPSHFISMDDPIEFTEAVQRFNDVSQRFARIPEEKDTAWLEAECIYKDLKGNEYKQPRWQMLVHCMNHSTYHRGQIVTMMRVAGELKIPQTDMIAYFREGNK